MFFPSAIVVVEGKTDQEYFERVIQNRLPNKRITVIQSGGDVKRKITGLKGFWRFDEKSFKKRLFCGT